METIEILRKYGDLEFLGSTSYMTKKHISKYFNVKEDTLDTVYRRNKDLFKKSRNFSKKEIEDIFREEKCHNRGKTLFHIKDIFIFINLLQDCVVAENLRKEFLGNKYVNRLRKEISFLDTLETVLKPMGLSGTRQYNVLSYKIDYYIESLNICVEYDEDFHSGYSYEEHGGRQKEIEKELGCNFIRVADDKSDLENVGQVISEILKIKNIRL